MANKAGVDQLFLTHHDPSHDDIFLDELQSIVERSPRHAADPRRLTHSPLKDTNTMDIQQRLSAMERLVEIGIMLTAETKLDRLLDNIVSEARTLLEVDGATIYLIHSDGLRFQNTQSASLEERMGRETFQSKVAPHVVPLTRD